MILGTIIFLASLCAFAMSSFVGGGASMVLIPLLSLVLPVTEVPGALVLGTCISSLSRAITMRSAIRWSIVRVFLPAAIPAVALGSWLLTYVDPLIATWCSACYVVLNIRLLLAPGASVSTSKQPLSLCHIAIVGSLAGILSGITGALGFTLNGFYLRSGLKKEEIVATRAANEILLHVIKLYFYAQFALYSSSSLYYGTLVVTAAVLSTTVARAVLPHIKDEIFRVVGYAAMTCSGLFLLVQSSIEIAETRTPSLYLTRDDDGIEATLRWGGSGTALEYEYRGDLKIERARTLSDLPLEVSSQIESLAHNCESYSIEEVFALHKHYYEVSVSRAGQILEQEIAAS